MPRTVNGVGKRLDYSGARRSGTASSRADINFASIIDLDVGGGWHVVRLSPDGRIISPDHASLKVLQQFFLSEPVADDKLPKPLEERFLESTEWGIRKSIRRQFCSFAETHAGVQLVVHLIPDSGGAYLLLKTRRAATKSVECSDLPLTERERGVVALVASGKTNVEIGILLGISARTVQKHLENIFRKLGVENRTAVAIRAVALLGNARPPCCGTLTRNTAIGPIEQHLLEC